MKLYLASSFDLKDRVEKIYNILIRNDYIIPDVWWKQDFKKIDLKDKLWYKDARVRGIAERHWSSIENCDAFVIIAPKDKSKKFNGANVELGYALALDKPCFAIGKLERSAMYVPVTKVKSATALTRKLPNSK